MSVRPLRIVVGREKMGREKMGRERWRRGRRGRVNKRRIPTAAHPFINRISCPSAAEREEERTLKERERRRGALLGMGED